MALSLLNKWVDTSKKTYIIKSKNDMLSRKVFNNDFDYEKEMELCKVFILISIANNNWQRWRTKTSNSDHYSTEDDQLRSKLKSLEETNLKLKTDKQILERQLLLTSTENTTLRGRNDKLSHDLKQSLAVQDTFLNFFDLTGNQHRNQYAPNNLSRSKSGDKIKIFNDYDDTSIKSPPQYQSHHKSDDIEIQYKNEAKLDIVPAFAKCLLADPNWEPRVKSNKVKTSEDASDDTNRSSVCESQQPPKQLTSFGMYKNNAVKKSVVSNYKPFKIGKILILMLLFMSSFLIIPPY